LAHGFVRVVVPAAESAAQIAVGVDRAARIQEPRFQFSTLRRGFIDRKSFGVLMLSEYAMTHSSMQTRAGVCSMTFLHGAMIFLTS
jgi:hypothetical protein